MYMYKIHIHTENRKYMKNISYNRDRLFKPIILYVRHISTEFPINFQASAYQEILKKCFLVVDIRYNLTMDRMFVYFFVL